jgi:hypothetical protein
LGRVGNLDLSEWFSWRLLLAPFLLRALAGAFLRVHEGAMIPSTPSRDFSLRRGRTGQDRQAAPFGEGADDDGGRLGKVKVGRDLFTEFITAHFGGDGASIGQAIKAKANDAVCGYVAGEACGWYVGKSYHIESG